MYQVLVDNVCVKEYPYKIQATMYCLMKGYVYSGWDDWENSSIGGIVILDPEVKIRKV